MLVKLKGREFVIASAMLVIRVFCIKHLIKRKRILDC